MYKKLMLLLGFGALLMGCSNQDIGLHTEVVEKVEIIGDFVVETDRAYDQSLDIMFYIDQSGSMGDEREALVNTMPSIYEELIGPDFNDLKWRVGVKSADDSQGYIENWVDWNDSNAIIKLSTLPLSMMYYGREGGLDAAIWSVAWDEDFHREEAVLLNVFISDEMDHSLNSVSTYETVMELSKADPFKVMESAIVSTPGGNECGWGWTHGTGYIDVSETVIDLCDTEDWVNVLDSARSEVLSLNKVWELTLPPEEVDLNSIEVYVDGDEWTKDTDWHYDSGIHAVVMDTLPESGSIVTIVYLYY